MKRALTTLMILATVGAGCKSATDDSALKKPKGANKLTYPVQVAPLEVRHVSYTVLAPGTIEAFQQVQITARVAGAVDRVSFVEGQQVKQGDALVAIETDRYQVAVELAKATRVSPCFTCCPSTNETRSTAPATRAVIWTCWNASIVPGARTV